MFEIGMLPALSRIMTLFYKLGLWSNEEESASRITGRKLIYVATFVIFNVLLISYSSLSEDKLEIVFLLEIEIVVMVLTMRLVHVIRRMEEIVTLLHDVAVHSISDNEELLKINHKMNFFLIFAYSQVVVPFLAMIIMVISSLPIFSSEKSLPYFIKFTYKWKFATLLYWLSFAFVTWAGMCCLILPFVNVIVWYLMLNCSIKFELLGNQFKKLGADIMTGNRTKEYRSQTEKQEHFYQDLIDLIKAHRNINKKVERLKTCFHNIFFVQMTTSGISICISTFILVLIPLTEENLSQLTISLFVLLYNFLDNFIILYLGNEIKLSSERLSYCLFESNWIDQSHSCKKCIIILWEALRQPLELIVFKLYPMNLETFTSILNFAYGMFNILKSFK